MIRDNFKIINFSFYFAIIIISLFFSLIYQSEIKFYYVDNIFTRYVHDLSKSKDFFEILIQKYNIHGIPFIPFNTKLNLLSFFNYDIKSQNGYIFYLILLRCFELITVFLFVFYFSKKKPNILSFIIFFLFIYNFNVFDHQSYINFPIIVFNIGLALSLILKQNRLLFIFILFITNFWSFFISPAYFIVTCFGPFLIFLLILIYEKKYNLIILSIFINLPFTLMYVMISLGTARFTYGNLITTETSSLYNFNLFNSNIHKLILIIMLLYFIYSLFLRNKQNLVTKEIKIFILITLFTIVFGYLKINYDLIKGLPHFIYIDYSLQYFYLAAISCFFLRIENFEKKIFLTIFVFLISYKIYSVANIYFSNNQLKANKAATVSGKDFSERYFWEVNNRFKFSEKYKNKVFLIDFISNDTQFVNSMCKDSKSKSKCKENIFGKYNNMYNHSFVWHEYQENKMLVNIGHSLLRGINSVAFFIPKLTSQTSIPKNTVPKTKIDFPLNKILNYDYLFTDKKLNLNIKEIINYNGSLIYIYNFPERKKFKITKLKKSKNLDDYLYDIDNLDEILYVEESIFDQLNLSDINYFCDFNYILDDSKYIKYSIVSNNSKYCFFVMPMLYSKTNNFYVEKKLIKTFKSQFFQHGGVFKNGDVITVKKKNIFLYSIYSFIDFIDFRKNNYAKS